MKAMFVSLRVLISTWFRSRGSLQMEIVALRHQFSVYQRSNCRLCIAPADRFLWCWIARCWSGWRDSVVFVQPETVISWQRKRFREHWRRLSQAGKPGRPSISKEIRELIIEISKSNPGCGSPRIVGELGKLDIHVAKSTVEKYRIRSSKPPSATWRAFLDNHLKHLVSIDFFVVPTVKFKALFVLVVLAHHRRTIVHFNVTEHPTTQWTAQQMAEAFPWDRPPKYLIRDRDQIYGSKFRKRMHTLGIEEVITAPRSPWQSPYMERVIGSIRRECLENVIILNERHLKRVLKEYLGYYHKWRTHLSLKLDAPESRPVHRREIGLVVEYSDVGGLHHHYERIAA